MTRNELSTRKNCRLCGDTRLSQALTLTPTPPANAYLSDEDILELKGGVESSYPLELFLCDGCGHLQLLHVVDPELLFGTYKYVSGTSPVFVDHFRHYAASCAQRLGPRAPGKMLEIGSNDGTMMAFMQDQGFEVLGVDPARAIAAASTASGLKTLPEFFSSTLARELRSSFGPVDLIVANNVLAHIDDLRDVIQGAKILLKPDGLLAFEVSYLVDVFEKTLFDTIYHEHVCYHAVRPLRDFFHRLDLELVVVERVASHGGSLRAFVQHRGGPHPLSPEVERFIAKEEGLGLFSIDTYRQFAQHIDAAKEKTHTLLRTLKAQGKKIAAFGAPAKATTLMHHFGIDTSLVDFIVDDSPLKQGLYTPGTHIPIVSSSKLYDQRPDYVVVLAWNFADSIIEKHRTYQERGGTFIVPLPDLKTVDGWQNTPRS